MPREKRINLRVDPALFELLEEKRFRERTSFQKVGVKLFAGWLESGASDPLKSGVSKIRETASLQAPVNTDILAQTEHEVALVRGVLKIARSGDTDYDRAITQIIGAGEDRVNARTRKPRAPRTPPKRH